MIKYSSYNKIILTIISLIFIPLISVCVYMEPVKFELTRMGGYLENDYGWNLPQEHFERPLFKLAKSIDDYTQYFDVVVVGDSFSENESHGWQNYLAKETGLSIITFNMIQTPVDKVITSPIYHSAPPKLFIYESVERNVISRHHNCNNDQQVAGISYNPPSIELNRLDVSITEITRDRRYYSFAGLDPSSAINYTKKAVARNILGQNITEVHRFQLSKPGLFSSKEDQSLLVLTRDFQLKGVSAQQLEIAKCSLLSLQNRIRNSNKTEFIALIFPDKTTVYSEYLVDKTYSDISIVNSIEQTTGLNVVQLVSDFKESVNKGVVDFYLPNDTHCGFYGYKITATRVLELLKRLVTASKRDIGL